jgi:putative heme-binding domain-containing protein
MIYLGDNWPEKYRNGLFMCNIHGRRVNHDTIERKGSGYVAKHAPDFFQSQDPWFRGLNMKYGPDGGVYLTDWSDTGECHNYEVAHKETGRIFKITQGTPKAAKVDLDKLSDVDLAKLQTHPNEWYARQARRRLQERLASGKIDEAVLKVLGDTFDTNPDPAVKLRALFTAYCLGVEDGKIAKLLRHADEHVQAWAVRLTVERGKPTPEAADELARIAAESPSLPVRLALTSSLQRLPEAERWKLVKALAGRDGSEHDANLPLMLWYGVEPLVPDAKGRDLDLLTAAKIPLLREFIARRITAASDKGIESVLPVLARANDSAARSDVLRGVLESLRGRKGLAKPAGWDELFPKLTQGRSEDRYLALNLALLFDDPRAVDALRTVASDAKAAPAERLRAIETLLPVRKPELLPWYQSLITDPTLRSAALRGLAQFDDPKTPGLILKQYPSFTPDEKENAVATLAARPAFASALLDAMENGTVPPRDVSAYAVLQLRRYNKPAINDRLNKVWGQARPTPAAKKEFIAKLKGRLRPDTLAAADTSKGRLLFDRNCATCHKMFGEGGAIGPELTGSQRANVEYVLENVVDPSAVVPGEYRVNTATLNSGRVVSGIIVAQNSRTVTLQTATERLVIDRKDIDEMVASNQSMMPEGILERMSDDEVRDLVAYLASPRQIPPPKR